MGYKLRAMKLDEETLDSLLKRLARAEGQVRAVRRMLEDGSDCRDIITQVSAATTALEQVGFRLLTVGLQQCIKNPAQAAREGLDLAEVEKMFLRLS